MTTTIEVELKSQPTPLQHTRIQMHRKNLRILTTIKRVESVAEWLRGLGEDAGELEQFRERDEGLDLQDDAQRAQDEQQQRDPEHLGVEGGGVKEEQKNGSWADEPFRYHQFGRDFRKFS